MKQGHWLNRLTEQADLPGESVEPLVELAGDRRVLIERHQGVTQYGCQRICVKVSYGTVCVEGAGLELARMWGSQLVIQGRIDRVEIHRRKC